MSRRKELVTITRDDFIKAGLNWQRFWWQPDFASPYTSYYGYLGISATPPNADEFGVTHQIARKVRLLASPHHHAFLMAYKARKEAKDEDTKEHTNAGSQTTWKERHQ
jgi:hypothetical protein